MRPGRHRAHQALDIRSERELPSRGLPERVALRAVDTAFRPALPAQERVSGRLATRARAVVSGLR
jgi:hypothetical protein